MKVWKILSPKVLTSEERPDNLTDDAQAKVKVTQLLLSGSDVRSYSGALRPKYPVVPGMFAVGVVGEAGAACVKVEKNTRVYIHDAFPCGGCAQCLAGEEENCSDLRTAGVNTEGFLRDFVVTEEANLSPLPPSVSDDEALFTGVISACEAVIDKLDAGKGTHIAVFGAGIFGNILSQLLIYHQAVPILVDESEERLAVAAQCGIYYTVKADEELKATITRITGGRLAAASVYCSYCGLPAELPFGLTAHAGKVVYAGVRVPRTAAAAQSRARQAAHHLRGGERSLQLCGGDQSSREQGRQRRPPASAQIFRGGNCRRVRRPGGVAGKECGRKPLRH